MLKGSPLLSLQTYVLFWLLLNMAKPVFEHTTFVIAASRPLLLGLGDCANEPEQFCRRNQSGTKRNSLGMVWHPDKYFLSNWVSILCLWCGSEYATRWNKWSWSIILMYGFWHIDSSVAQRVKHACNAETQVWSLGWEDTMEKEMAPHSRTLAWTIPRMEEPGRLQSMGLQKVGRNWATSLHSLYGQLVVVLVARSCPTLCDPLGCGPPGSSVHGVLQARILEGVATSFSINLLQMKLEYIMEKTQSL